MKRKTLKELERDWKQQKAALMAKDSDFAEDFDEVFDDYLDAMLCKYTLTQRALDENGNPKNETVAFKILDDKTTDIIEFFRPHTLSKEECAILTEELKKNAALAKEYYRRFYMQGVFDTLFGSEIPIANGYKMIKDTWDAVKKQEKKKADRLRDLWDNENDTE